MSDRTTTAMLDGCEIVLDDACQEGELVTVRTDADDLDSPLVGTFLLCRDDAEGWVLK